MPDARPNGRARQATRRELTDAISETVHVVNNHGPAILELQSRLDAQAIRIKKLEERLNRRALWWLIKAWDAAPRWGNSTSRPSTND